MSRKDYQLIANTIKAATQSANLTQEQQDALIQEFCWSLKSDNGNFQPARFTLACK